MKYSMVILKHLLTAYTEQLLYRNTVSKIAILPTTNSIKLNWRAEKLSLK